MRSASKPRVILALWLGLFVALFGACDGGTIVPACTKVMVEAVLHVDADDPRQVWATDVKTGAVLATRPRTELGWRVDPDADPGRLLDPSGDVATFEGEIFRQACVDTETDTLLIGPEDLPDPNRPPN